MRIYPLLSTSTRPGPYTWLLVSLLALLFASVQSDALPWAWAVTLALLGVSMIASIYPVREQRLFVYVGSTFAAITFLSLCWARVSDVSALNLVALGTGFIFFLHAALVNLITILGKTLISTDELAGAISAYLLLGISGAFAFACLDLVEPGSILNTSPLIPTLYGEVRYRPFSEYLYFSFASMTTLGFGDIVPATPLVRLLAYLEAVMGQVYLTVLVARLVGLHLTHSRGGKR